MTNLLKLEKAMFKLHKEQEHGFSFALFHYVKAQEVFVLL